MIKFINKQIQKQHLKSVKYLEVRQLISAPELKQTNEEIVKEFNLSGPLMMSFPSKRVHEARWAMLRESYLASYKLSATHKEIIATTISKLNRCPYCVEAHGAGIITLGESKLGTNFLNGSNQNSPSEFSEFIRWLNAVVPTSNKVKPSSFPLSQEDLPEVIATIIVFHSVNRFTNLFLNKSPLPVSIENQKVRNWALKFSAKTVFKFLFFKKVVPKKHIAGKIDLASAYEWSNTHPTIGTAIQQELLVLKDIESSINKQCITIFNNYLNAWEGESQLGKGWIKTYTAGLPDKETQLLNLLFIAAFQSHTLVDSDISNFRKYYPKDQFLVEVCYYAIQKIAHQLGNNIWKNMKE